MTPFTHIRGRLGVVDAYLVSCLCDLSLSSVHFSLDGALYPEIISEADLALVLSGLRQVASVNSSPPPNALDLPERELMEASLHHFLAGQPVPCRVTLRGPDLRLEVGEILDLYGRTPGKRDRPLIAVSGCFDVFHANHYRLIAAAKRVNPGGRLLVITLSDGGVARLEKNHARDRPIYPECCRAHLLSAFRDLAHLLVVDDVDCRAALDDLGVDLYVKNVRDPHRSIVAAEAGIVRNRGGRAVFVELPGVELSSTQLIGAIRSRYGCDAKEVRGERLRSTS